MDATQRSQALLQSPEALMVLRNGFEKLATPIASTLGPSQRVVMNSISSQEIELLADTGTIAQRFVELKLRGENIGAMMLRTMVIDIHERYGDGAATATVLARDMIREGIKLIAAGVNSSIMKRGIERGVAIAQAELKKQSQTVEGQEMLSRLAIGATGDTELGNILGEVVDTIGDHNAIVIHENDKPFTDREYASGGHWYAYPADRTLIPEGNTGLELHNPVIMVVNEDIKTVEQVQGILELVVELPNKPPLVIIAPEIADAARDMLVLNHARGVLTTGLAVLSTGRTMIHEDLEDIAILTGGEVLAQEVGRSPQYVQLAYLGRARKVTLTRRLLTILDGAGDKQLIRKRVSEVRARMKQPDEERDRLRARLARMSGGVGVIKVGAYSEQEREVKKKRVEKTLLLLDAVQEQGVVAGGGIAYLNCIQAVEEASRTCTNNDEAAGMRLVAKALTAPFLQLAHNYGYVYPPLALDEVRRRGANFGLDTLQGDYVNMAERGILDSTKITIAALNAGASTAAMAISTDSIVLM